MSKLTDKLIIIWDGWLNLWVTSPMKSELDEEHYRQRILVTAACFWLLIVIALSLITPFFIEMTGSGKLASGLLFIVVSTSVFGSLSILRYSGNRFLALNFLLVSYTVSFSVGCFIFGGVLSPTFALLIMAPVMAAIAGSVASCVAWSLIILFCSVVVVLLDRSGYEFRQIIAPQNYTIAIATAYAGMGVAILSILVVYAEMNHKLRERLVKNNLALEHLSTHDVLTELPNRRYYERRLSLALERGAAQNKYVGLMVIDLDGFKAVNDNYGHGAGDILLITVASRLKCMLRETDFVARLGGDEFVVILEDIASKQEVIELSLKLAKSIDEPLRVRTQRIKVSASIGISLYPAHGENHLALQEKADQAMYKAKQDGVSVVVAAEIENAI